MFSQSKLIFKLKLNVQFSNVLLPKDPLVLIFSKLKPIFSEYSADLVSFFSLSMVFKNCDNVMSSSEVSAGKSSTFAVC